MLEAAACVLSGITSEIGKHFRKTLLPFRQQATHCATTGRREGLRVQAWLRRGCGREVLRGKSPGRRRWIESHYGVGCCPNARMIIHEIRAGPYFPPILIDVTTSEWWQVRGRHSSAASSPGPPPHVRAAWLRHPHWCVRAHQQEASARDQNTARRTSTASTPPPVLPATLVTSDLPVFVFRAIGRHLSRNDTLVLQDLAVSARRRRGRHTHGGPRRDPRGHFTAEQGGSGGDSWAEPWRVARDSQWPSLWRAVALVHFCITLHWPRALTWRHWLCISYWKHFRLKERLLHRFASWPGMLDGRRPRSNT